MIETAAEESKQALCDKPLAFTVHESQRAVAAVQAADIRLQGGSSDPDWLPVSQAVDSGSLGELGLHMGRSHGNAHEPAAINALGAPSSSKSRSMTSRLRASSAMLAVFALASTEHSELLHPRREHCAALRGDGLGLIDIGRDTWGHGHPNQHLCHAGSAAMPLRTGAKAFVLC